PQKRTLMGPRLPWVSFPKDDPNHYALYRLFIIARFCAPPFPDALVETSRQRPSPAPEIGGRSTRSTLARNSSHFWAMSVSMVRFCPGAKARAISRHDCARFRYSSALLLITN